MTGPKATTAPEAESEGWFCVYCSCSDEKACEGGCTWVEPGVCSACVEVHRFTQETVVPWLMSLRDEQIGNILSLFGGMYVGVMRDNGLPDPQIWQSLTVIDDAQRAHGGKPAAKAVLVRPDGRPF